MSNNVQLAEAIVAAAFMALTASSASAAPCESEDFESRLTGVSQCLLIKHYGPKEATAIVVWLHGDVSDGGPANYHFKIAQKAAQDFAEAGVVSVAIVRPGYPDGSGASSTVRFTHGGRSDHYTQENIAEVGAVVEKLRLKYRPKHLIMVGHSGGAATAAVLLGMKPQLAESAVLVGCPCDIVGWRSGRREWSRSENPTRWADRISASTKVVAVTGSQDDNTLPYLASAYVDLLKSRGIDATFKLAAGATHNSALRSPEVFEAIAGLLRR